MPSAPKQRDSPPLETFLFSVLACSGSAQMASVGLVVSSSGPVAIVLTALGLSMRHVLYGLSLATWLPRATRPPTPLLAATVFDEGFGVTTREAAAGRGSAAFLFGANGLTGCSISPGWLPPWPASS